MSTESQNPSVNPNVHFQQCEPSSSWPVHKADQAVTRVRYAGRRHHTAIASTQAVYYFMYSCLQHQCITVTFSANVLSTNNKDSVQL